MSLRYVDNGTSAPRRFRATFYDYSDDRTLVAEGDLAGREPIAIDQAAFQPLSNEEEFDEAVAILETGRQARATTGQWNSETIQANAADDGFDRDHRAVGECRPRGCKLLCMTRSSASALRGARSSTMMTASRNRIGGPEGCGPPADANNGSGSGGPDHYDAGRLTAVGDVGSKSDGFLGDERFRIEIQNVKYKGKLVLKRGHVPVLDVQYADNVCGPYRDWQDEQDSFDAPAAGATYPNGPTGGIVILAAGQVARTILETGNDAGNFKGVAIYRQNTETVMVTEMTAGWYRYIMEWRFADDGTIRPRFGFGTTTNDCVCFDHYHHVYWRFDFDIVQPNNKVFQVERGQVLQPITTEINRNKSIQTTRSILIRNSNGNEAYKLVPNVTDGTVDTFGVNDLWVLRYKAPTGNPITSEIDDGRVCCGGPNQNIAINGWVNGESVV